MTKSCEISPVPEWSDEVEQTVITDSADEVFETVETDLLTASATLPPECFGTDNANAVLRAAIQAFWADRADYAFRNAFSARYFAVTHAGECVADAMLEHLTSTENPISVTQHRQVLTYVRRLKNRVLDSSTSDTEEHLDPKPDFITDNDSGMSRLQASAERFFSAAHSVLAAGETYLPPECQGKKNADDIVLILYETIDSRIWPFRHCDSAAIEELGPRLAADTLALVLKIWLRPDRGNLSQETEAQIALFCNDIRYAVTHTLPNP